MININPSTPFAVLLAAASIPDAAEVTKRTGEQIYTLKRNITVYQADKSTPLSLDGHFLLGPRGSINQISADTLLLWRLTAESLFEELEEAWEGTPQ